MGSAAPFVRAAFRQLYFRDPDADEIKAAKQFMASWSTGHPESGEPKTPQAQPQVAFLHALLNSNELIYVD